jgi:hypothetical protein
LKDIYRQEVALWVFMLPRIANMTGAGMEG